MVFQDRKGSKMLHTGCDAEESRHVQVGLADCKDGIHWEKFSGNPVSCCSDPTNLNEFGRYETEGWGLILDKNRHYLSFKLVRSRRRQISLACSENLVDWEELGRVLPSSGLPWQVGYIRYSAWPFKCEGNTPVFASVSDVNYAKSRLGLWRIHGPSEDIERTEFLGFMLESSDWCKNEIDTPWVLRQADGLCLVSTGGRSARNKCQEGLALLDIGGLHEPS